MCKESLGAIFDVVVLVGLVTIMVVGGIAAAQDYKSTQFTNGAVTDEVSQ